ncbi:MAG: hypothetical protein IKW20_04590 [Bacteroidales bacterium]|nr:hypothetical protein [Bacteroidales bacterium]
MKCKHCGSSNVQGTNVGTRIFAGVCGGVVGLLCAPFTGGSAGGHAKNVYKEICPSRDYICLSCKRTFSC